LAIHFRAVIYNLGLRGTAADATLFLFSMSQSGTLLKMAVLSTVLPWMPKTKLLIKFYIMGCFTKCSQKESQEH